MTLSGRSALLQRACRTKSISSPCGRRSPPRSPPRSNQPRYRCGYEHEIRRHAATSSPAAATIGVLFVGGIFVFGAVLAPLTGPNELAAAGPTLLVFALFQ